MNDNRKPDEKEAGEKGRSDNFERLAEAKSPSLPREFFDFMRHNRKWWLAPIIAAVLVLSFFIVLTSTPLAPFIYSLF